MSSSNSTSSDDVIGAGSATNPNPNLNLNPADVQIAVAVGGTVANPAEPIQPKTAAAAAAAADPHDEELSCFQQLKNAFMPVKRVGLKKQPRHLTLPHERVCCGVMSADTLDVLISVGFLLIELFRVVMASVLTVLVPTFCGDPNNGSQHSCALSEIVATPFGAFAFALNIITLSVAALHYVLLYHREKFFIRTLDSHVETAMDRLAEILPVYDDVDIALYRIHLRTFVMSILLGLFFVGNIIVSGVFILKDHYAGYQSVTVYATNIGLLLTAMYHSTAYSFTGLRHKVALSMFVFAPQSFNVLDHDYVDPRDETNGGRVDKDDENGKPIVPDFRNKPMPTEEHLAKRRTQLEKKEEDD